MPESVFREYSHTKRESPFKGAFDHFDSIQVALDIDDLKDAVYAEVALNFWGGHSGTSDQTFKVNGSEKINFPQPNTPGNPYCYFRCIHGNRPVKITLEMLKKGENKFTFFCGDQICYGFKWPHYWLNSFTVRVYYDKELKKCVKGTIKKWRENDVAYNGVGFNTDVDDSTLVKSVEYIGYYEDYDLDGDGNPAGWQYTVDKGVWDRIIGRQSIPPYDVTWNNNWVPQQNGPIKVMAKINSKNGLSYLTPPVEFNKLRQHNSTVKIYGTEKLDENFGVRDGRRKQCIIPITDSLTNADTAYLLLSSWSAKSEDGTVHMVGINGKLLAESPGKLHDWAFLQIPVPIEYLKSGDNTFFIYSETKGHMFEVNYPGPSLLIRYANHSKKNNWGTVSVGKDDKGYFVANLENEKIKVRYAPKIGKEVQESIIKEVILKTHPEINIAGRSIDGAAHRGLITKAEVIKDAEDEKTIYLEWATVPGKKNKFPGPAKSEISIFRDSSVLKIKYINFCFSHICDLGLDSVHITDANWGGKSRVYGIDLDPLPQYENCLYWRKYGDFGCKGVYATTGIEGDPGPLSYKGWMVMGAYNSANNIGYGRVIPAENIRVIKLLWNKGFELFPQGKNFIGYMYFFDKGENEVLSIGKGIVDKISE